MQSLAPLDLEKRMSLVPGRVTPGWEKFLFIEWVARILDVIQGSDIIPIPEYLEDLVVATNRVCRFSVGSSSFGTGLLVGPSHVLTAAHLFFDDDGKLTDPARIERATADFVTTYAGNVVVNGELRSVRLKPIPLFSADPIIKLESGIGTAASFWRAIRDVDHLDYAIIRLDDSDGDVADDLVGEQARRGAYQIPAIADCSICNPGLQVQALQFIDGGALRTAAGAITQSAQGGSRAHHTASTVDGSSGSPIFDVRLRLAAVHLGGSTNPAVRENESLPLRRVAENLSIREELKWPKP